MVTTTKTITVDAEGYRAEIQVPADYRGGEVAVEISADGVIAGCGTYSSEDGITDCDAILGGSQDAADRIYAALTDALDEAVIDATEPQRWSVERIEAELERRGVSRKAFWGSAGVDPMPLPGASVRETLASLER